jgi:hypothetical protein
MDRITHWARRAESFLDGYGRGAWIAAFVLGFILFWPVGLAILGYTIWSGRMGCWKFRRTEAGNGHRRNATGNSAFDDYREETLRRLQEEQTEFEGFLARLRRSNYMAEFDHLMDERRRGSRDAGPQTA